VIKKPISGMQTPIPNNIDPHLSVLDKIELGRTGIMVSRLSFGTGTNGWAGHSDQSVLGIEKLAELLQLAFERGVNFWDTADEYGTHPHIAKALQSVPRHQVVIATKTMSRTAEKVTHDINRFLEELKTDYIDIVLLHVMSQANWHKKYSEVMEALSQAKEQGKVRAMGISSHSLRALRAAAETDWTDVVLARINYAGVNMDGSTRKVVPILRQLYDSGKAVYGMKVLGCGRLGGDVCSAIQYVFQLGTVHAITIGMTHQGQLFENIKHVHEFSTRFPIQNL
jgi:aryl-alcohol dehydrogenase-like predicted oxidoreductase